MRAHWTRPLVLIGALIVGVATAATSAVSLYHLAVKCGIPEPWAAALPVALDVGAAVAALAWITETGVVRTWARGIAVGCLVASLAGNAAEHAITSGLLPVTLPLVLVVGACIPATLWAVVHLAALTTTHKPVLRVKPQPKPAPARPTPSTEPKPKPGPQPVDDTPAEKPVDLSRRARGKQWAREHWPVTGGQIADFLGVSRAEGSRIRAAVAREIEAAS